ncbi:MAG: hypothetical protein Q7R41_14875 [Phycisphaerales bacterium]|nr:hypothetical protein [Phycisphaerales bacterium]
MPKAKRTNTAELDFLSVYRTAFDAALQDRLRELHFAECTTGKACAEVYLAAEKLARGRVDEYVQRNLSATDYERYKLTDRFYSALGAKLDAPFERMIYRAAKLGICKATDGINGAGGIMDTLGRYMIAVHGWTRFQFEHTDCGTIADILEKDAIDVADPAEHAATVEGVLLAGMTAEPTKGEALCARAGVEYNGYSKGALSALKKRGACRSIRGPRGGYVRKP